MVQALQQHMHAFGTDIVDGQDFFQFDAAPQGCDAIISNPEFRSATATIERALMLMEPNRGFVAMLLPSNFDAAKSRRHLFGACPQFAKRITLTKRIIWFDRPGAAPSENHFWGVWDWRHTGAPVLAYAGADIGAAQVGSTIPGPKVVTSYPRRALPIRTAARPSPRTAARRRIGAQR
jgi:hypothetical protein